MRGRKAVLAVAVALLAPATAHAGRATCTSDTAPLGTLAIGTVTVSVCANNQLYTFPTDAAGKAGTFGPVHQTLGFNAQGEEAYFTFNGIYNADPFVIFSFGSVLPAGFGPVTFDAFFTTPVVGGPYNTATSTVGVTVTSIAGGVGGVTAGTYPTYISGLADATNLGVDAGSGPCVATAVCGPFNASNTGAPLPVSPASLTAHLSYTHTSTGTGATSAGWTGAVDLTATAVPEPATFGLLLGGMLLTGIVIARRRSER
jgi:hypothetical protein